VVVITALPASHVLTAPSLRPARQILSTMRKMLHDQEKEDVAKRAAKVAAGKRYQEELDQQLNELRTRSFNSLASKFSPFFLCWVLYSVAILFDACILFCADNLNARCVESSNDVIHLNVGRKLIAVKPSTCVFLCLQRQ
jgi:hypothetical protein